MDSEPTNIVLRGADRVLYILSGYTRDHCAAQVDRMRQSYPGYVVKEEPFYTDGDGFVKCRLSVYIPNPKGNFQ